MLDIFKAKKTFLTKVEMMKLTRQGILQSAQKSELLKLKLKTEGIVDATASVKYALNLSGGAEMGPRVELASNIGSLKGKREISNKNSNQSLKRLKKVIEDIATRSKP